jgi:hypothetical protein
MGPLLDEMETHFEEEDMIFDFAEESCSSFVEHESDNVSVPSQENTVLVASSSKVFVCSKEHRVLVASDAAAMGRLTRLGEHIVDSVAIGNTTDDGCWSGIKSADQLDSRSTHIRVVMEAAALVRLSRGSERRYTVANWDQDVNEHKADNNNEYSMISSALSKLEEAEYQVDDILQEIKALGEVDPDSIDDVMLLLFSLKGHIDSLSYHYEHLPSRVSSLIDDAITEQRDDISKSWAHHMTVLEALETYQNTKDTFDGQHLAVLPCLQEPAFVQPLHYMTKKNMRDALAIQAAKGGMRRTDQLSKATSIRIRPTCTCPYCGSPSSFQTQSYKKMRARRKANDESLKKELVGIARKRPAKRTMVRRSISVGNHSQSRKVVARGPMRSYSMVGLCESPSQNNEDGPSEDWVSPMTQRRQAREATKKNEIKEPALLQRFGEWISPSSNRSAVKMARDAVGSRPPLLGNDLWVSPLSERRKLDVTKNRKRPGVRRAKSLHNPGKTKFESEPSIRWERPGKNKAKSDVGPLVGPELGHEVGPGVGPLVGPDVGPNTGPDVGPDVSSLVGPDAGPAVGLEVGPEVGPDVGSDSPKVGPDVGPEVGPDEWREVGSEVGPVIDSEVGPDVGPDMGPDVGPKVGPEADPEVGPDVWREVGPEVGPVIDSEVGPDAGPDVGPDVGPKVGPEVGPEVGQDVEREVGPEVGPVIDSEVGPDAGPDVGPDVGPKVSPDFGPEVGPDVWREVGREVGPVIDSEVGPDIGPDMGPDVGPKVGPELGPDVGAEVGPDVWREVGPEVGPVIDFEVGPDAGPDVGPDVGPKVGPDVGAEVGPDVWREVGPEVGPEVRPVVGPEVGPDVGPDVGPPVGPDVGPLVGEPIKKQKYLFNPFQRKRRVKKRRVKRGQA